MDGNDTETLYELYSKILAFISLSFLPTPCSNNDLLSDVVETENKINKISYAKFPE